MLDFLAEYGYWGLFLASFLSATVLPFSSELVLSLLLVSGASPTLCLICGTIGNTLGGMTCYWIGLCGKVSWMETYLKIPMEKVEKVQKWIRKKGAAAAFLSFLPAVGDLFAVALGFLRANPWLVLFFMCLGKFLRYYVWMIINNYVVSAF